MLVIPYVVLGNEDGGVVLFPSNGDVPLLAVRPAINVDDSNRGIAAFLENCGARRTVRQIEMERVAYRELK